VPVTTIAAIAAATVAGVLSALCVVAWLKVSREVRRLRSLSSALAELHEIRDYMAKLDAWSKRLNSRLVMQERNRQPTSEPTPLDPAAGKDQLRRMAGIVPGRPAPHR